MGVAVDKPTLRDDQVADLAFYIREQKCMNLSDPGVGKTPSVCVMQWYRWSRLQVGTVWVMPKRLMEKNRRELLRFTSFTDEDITIVDGTPAQVAKQLASGAKVFLMGPRRFTLCWHLLPKHVRAMDVDEFHMCFKHPNSAACQALFAAFNSGQMQGFIPMTGTIISGRLDSAYPAIHVIEPRYYPSYEAFLYQHAIRDADDKIIGWTNHGKLSAIFGRHAIRRTFESVHGRHDPVLLPEVVPMHPRQREMYDKFHEDAILELEKFYLDGTQPGVGFIRARQLMEHPNEFPDLTNPGAFIDVMPRAIPSKEELLEVHLADHENTGDPLIIFSAMIPQQRRIATLLESRGFKFGVINGMTSARDSDRIDQAFQAGEINTIICSPACASIGFNWQFCGKRELTHMIFTTLDFLDTTLLQAIRRGIRGPREKALRVSIFEYEDSLDQHLFGIIYRKSMDAHKVDPSMPVLQLSGYQKEYNMK